MNIIFGDIDGVLNCAVFNAGLRSDFVGPKICRDRVELLNRLLNMTNANLVISSDWRRHNDLERLQSMFASKGFEHEILGVTPTKDKVIATGPYSGGRQDLEGDRVSEIGQWLMDNGEFVDKWVAIDDMDLTKGNICPDNFVKTTFMLGLTEDLMMEAERKLNG